MPDITLCQSSVCEMREKCYRFTAKEASGNQSYFIPAKTYPDCEYFMEAVSKSQVRRLDSQTK